MSLPLRVPAEVERVLAGRHWSAVDVGMSKADVFRCDGGLYLKTVRRIDDDVTFGNLEEERARLEWLDGKLPVPTVVAFARDETRDYLVLSEIPGRHAAADAPAVAVTPRLVEALAAACRLFHSVSTSGCPFAASAESLVRLAGARLERGLVDADDFDAERKGRSEEELLRELVALQPEQEDSVIVHGDFCLPNIILQGESLSGFIDVGRAGVSDRWRDLALSRTTGGHHGRRCFSLPTESRPIRASAPSSSCSTSSSNGPATSRTSSLMLI